MRRNSYNTSIRNSNEKENRYEFGFKDREIMQVIF